MILYNAYNKIKERQKIVLIQLLILLIKWQIKNTIAWQM